MELANYKMGFVIIGSNIRHIALVNKEKSLCKVRCEFYHYSNLDTSTQFYPDIFYLHVCPKCFQKLPIKIQTEIKFRYMVWKLKK